MYTKHLTYIIIGIHRDTAEDPDHAIDAYFYYIDDDRHTLYYSMRPDMVEYVRNGDKAYSYGGGKYAKCKVVTNGGVSYLQSDADRYAPNNLLNLPEMDYADAIWR